MARPAGIPSRIATSALPCDSPAVRKRSIRRSFYPKYFQPPVQPPLTSRAMARAFAVAAVAIAAGHLLAPRPAHDRGGTMRLLADRFAIDAGGRAIDLASGARVAIAIACAGGIADQLRWHERCGLLHQLQHRALAPPRHHGPVGDGSRVATFEVRG